MTWKDKLEIGLKDDAPYRRDNLPDFQRRKAGPPTKPDDPSRSPEEPGARQDAANASRPTSKAVKPARTRTAPRKKNSR
jgi:hypothetical protein